MFSLEALRAREGDSLLLHFGEAEAPKLILIDGGPSGVYRDALKPRLEQLRGERGVDSLPVELLMISHVDSDHVRGILDLSREMVDDVTLRESLSVDSLWHNSFEDALGEEAVAELAEVVSARPAEAAEPAGLNAVVASVGEGRDLRGNAKRLGWPINDGFDDLIMAPESGREEVEFGELKLTVVGPLEAEVIAFRKEWDKEIAKLRAKQAAEGRQADYSDDSPWNLASIVCLVELADKRMLLTGDALGSRVLDGLRGAKLLDQNGQLELDLLKVPHHGSERNVTQKFFEALPAEHYLI
ncbi:MAG: hypothetical protein M3355_02500, partial [Actinomycetota bacterium]|nr:hypothetical protein [Actinomycetota bacterium]